MKNLSLQKKMVVQVVLVCSFLVAISGLSLHFQKQVSTSYREVSSNQFPKVESLSKLVANFRLIRIKVRTLGLTGNTKADQVKYIDETKKAIHAFLEENKKFNAMDFTEKEMAYVKKMNMGWNSFLNFGKDLLSQYENPTKESLIKGSNMIRVTCPIEANKWMSVAQSFLTYQSEKTQNQVASSMIDENNILKYSSVGLFLSFAFSVFMGFLFSKSISNKIIAISNILKENTNHVKNSSESVSSNSTQLSKSSTTAASSLQETVSSIDEISSMIQKNADAANSSTQVSLKSSDVASQGKKTVESMIESINEISSSNAEIAKEMETNNEEISKIVSVISEIGEKTKVINDIVFQTKLLSFNASVEAARAGEHGKGFAVVAEEVGNLAAMSGKAALEITEMLDRSIKQVTEIVENAKKKVDSLVSTSKVKVDAGTKTAFECGDSLDEILQNVTSVNEMVREIATASSEQSTGVQEVTKAMQQLDQLTHENTSVAQKSSLMAKNLSEQAVSLDRAVKDLVILVNGRLESEDNVEKIEEEDSRVINFSEKQQTRKSPHHSSSDKKVSGSDLSIPDENDSRFEDL